jgi:translation factor GUF1, mitochondrial
MQAIVERIPPPTGLSSSRLRALAFDSWFDAYRGVVSLVSLADGTVGKGGCALGCIEWLSPPRTYPHVNLDRAGDKLTSAATGKTYEVNDVGILHPDAISLPTNSRLRAGQVGWLTCGMKDATEGGSNKIHPL